MAELLIELFSEEIPARMQRQAAGDLQRLITDGLTKANLTFDETRIYWTPRRLTLVVEGLPTRQPDLREEKKGPKVGAPDQAVQGFLRSAGLDSLDQCEQQDTPKGPVWIAVVEKKGGASSDVLPSLIEAAIRALPWPKSMRFAAQSFRWVRPLHRILAVFDGAALAGDFDLGGATVAFSNTSSGHRFLSPEPFTVLNFSDYIAKLRDAHVVLDPEERKQAIADGLRSAADREGLTVKDDPALLEEVTNLVEYPDVLIGKIDSEFMRVPDEVLSTSMRSHQKYFSLVGLDGSLAPRFAVVANMKAVDGGAKIVAGNERVLRARLADAKFFWDQDRAIKLQSRLPALERMVFHAKLGTVLDRVYRMERLAGELSQFIPNCDQSDAKHAALLAKADLTTQMVGEFPELQGVMGFHYALNEEEKPSIAGAIALHYSPVGPNDRCPSAPVAVCVALAEKLDTLAAFWLIDETPTGSKDPYALRRAALGVIRLILENKLRIPLLNVLAPHAGFINEFYNMGLSSSAYDDIENVKPLLSFFADRLRVHLKDEGVSHSLIQALFALGDEDDLVRLVARVHALKAFLESEDGANLLTAYRRAANILRAEEKKDGTTYSGKPDSALFATPEETALAAALDAAEDQVKACIDGEDFGGAMTALAGLRQPVDAFFEAVIVNADEADLRKNRLLLLARIRSVMGTLADFGQIEG